MAYSSYLRDKAEQALRLARDSTDQVLVKSLIEVAAALGEDPENNCVVALTPATSVVNPTNAYDRCDASAERGEKR